MPLASATSRILRATSRVSSAMDRFLYECGGILEVRSRAVEAHRQDACDVKGCTVRAIGNLMPARGAVGDDQRAGIRAPPAEQQREFGQVHQGLNILTPLA